MAESLAEFYARNLAEQIRRVAGNEYAKWALQARSQYIDLRLRQDGEIRKLYLKAAEEAQKLIGRRNRWPSDEVLRQRLGHIIADLNEIADTLRGDFEALLRRDITKAVEAGAAYSQAIMMRLLGDTFSSGELRRIFARVNQQAVEACWARTRNGLHLSDRIWQKGQEARDAMKEIIQNGVALGMDAKDVARALEQYVRSDASTLARQYPNMMKRMGKRIPKNLIYEALRLARTEMTAAFGEGTIAAARVSPSYVGMKWVLSKAHPLPDVCDSLATLNEYGLGAGVYSPGNEPIYPAHPNCLCVLVPVHEQPSVFQQRLRRWVENPESEPDLERWYTEIYTKQAIRQVSRPSLTAVAAPSGDLVGSWKHPVIVRGFHKLGRGGVSDPWVGHVGSEKYLFKPDRPLPELDMKRSNLEAEILASKVMNHCGVPCPRSDYGWFRPEVDRVRKLLRVEWVSDGVIGQKAWADGLGIGEIDIPLFQRMQVLDVLMGNADRHSTNFFFVGRRVVPIDHNLAFGTDMVFRDPETTWQKAFLATMQDLDYCQKPSWILRRNKYGAAILDVEGVSSYWPIIEDVQRRLTDDDIDRMVTELPDVLAGQRRKEELQRILRWRRDHLKDLFEEARE